MAANHTNTESSSTLRARSRLLLLAAVLLIAASCSGGSGASATPTVLLTSTAPTTVATTTTTQATTTTEDPAIAHERDVAEITEVYEVLLNYSKQYGPVPNEDAVAEFAAEPLRTIYLTNLESWEQQGLIIGESTKEHTVLDVEITDDTAILHSCNLDGTSLVTSDGQVVIPADTEHHLRETRFLRTFDGWRITESTYQDGKATTCEG